MPSTETWGREDPRYIANEENYTKHPRSLCRVKLQIIRLKKISGCQPTRGRRKADTTTVNTERVLNTPPGTITAGIDVVSVVVPFAR